MDIRWREIRDWYIGTISFQGSSDKLNGQLKMHLDSIFDGFQKLISGPDERHESRKMPFVIEKTIHNILFIKTHMQRQDEFDAVRGFLLFYPLCPKYI